MKALCLLLLAASAASAQTIAIVGGTVHTVDGEVIENGIVLIEDGRIQNVGRSLSIPSNARRLDADGKIVTPGLIDIGTSVGLIEVLSLADTRDASLDNADPFRPSFRVTDGLNPYSIVIPVTRLGGVTTVASLPSGGILAGQAVVIDLTGRRAADMIVREPAALVGAFNPAAAETVGGARGALALRLREALDDARFYGENEDAFGSAALRELSISRLDLEALKNAMSTALPFVVRASSTADIDAAMALAGEYDLDLVVLGGEEAWRRSGDLAASETPVIVKAYANVPVQFDRLGARFDNAALLAKAGVRVVLSTLETHNARNLRFEAGQAVRHGMKWEEALRAVTLTPAEVMGIADTHGSLETGKTANVVVWSGDPFEPASAAEHVFIRGREIEHDSRQIRLLERYKNLDGRPVQYLGNPTP